jgi:hypothetical protein
MLSAMGRRRYARRREKMKLIKYIHWAECWWAQRSFGILTGACFCRLRGVGESSYPALQLYALLVGVLFTLPPLITCNSGPLQGVLTGANGQLDKGFLTSSPYTLLSFEAIHPH